MAVIHDVRVSFVAYPHFFSLRYPLISRKSTYSVIFIAEHGSSALVSRLSTVASSLDRCHEYEARSSASRVVTPPA